MWLRPLIVAFALAGCAHKNDTTAMSGPESVESREGLESRDETTASRGDASEGTGDAPSRDKMLDSEGMYGHGVRYEALNDGQITAVLATTAQAQVSTAQAALPKLKNPDVRRFAQAVVTHHTEIAQQARARITADPAASETLNGLEHRGGDQKVEGAADGSLGAAGRADGSGVHHGGVASGGATGAGVHGSGDQVGATGARGTTSHVGPDGQPVAGASGAPGTVSQAGASGLDQRGPHDGGETASFDPNMPAGPEMERAFMAKMVVEHERILSLLDMMAPQAQDPALTQIIDSVRPTLQQHLDGARRIEASLDTSSVGMGGSQPDME